MEKRERLYWNVVKGIAIFLMLWGHCIQYCAQGSFNFFAEPVFKAMYSFHMPLFMLVSGYLFYYSFRKRDLKELLVHRIQGMLHPIVFATFLDNLLMTIPHFILSDRIDILFGSLFKGIEYDFWFLWAVLISSVVLGVACKITEKMPVQIILAFFGIFVILLFPQWNMTLFMYPFFVVGFFCGMYRSQLEKIWKYGKYVFLVVFPLMLPSYDLKHYIYQTPMYSPELGLRQSLEIATFRCAIGFAGSGFVLAIVEGMLHIVLKTGNTPKTLSIVSKLGENSLQLYCLSVPLLSGYLPHLYAKAIELMGGNLFAQNMFVYNFVFTPILTVIWTAGLYMVIVLLRKTGADKLIFGR